MVTLGATAYVTERFSVYTTIDTQFASSFLQVLAQARAEFSTCGDRAPANF